MIKAIIFDLDGTLLNTIADIQAVLNECLAKYSLKTLSEDQTKQFVGNGARKLVECAVGDTGPLCDEVYKCYSVRFSECGNERTTLYDEERETLKKLNSMGIKLAILTNKPQKATENVYKKYLSEFKFDRVCGQSEKFPLKPNPEAALHILEELNVSPEECLFVGDGEADIMTAKNANIKCISVLWGYRTEEQLKKAGGMNFCKHFSDILNFLQ
jgi:phosphoglycolate phosphatase